MRFTQGIRPRARVTARLKRGLQRGWRPRAVSGAESGKNGMRTSAAIRAAAPGRRRNLPSIRRRPVTGSRDIVVLCDVEQRLSPTTPSPFDMVWIHAAPVGDSSPMRLVRRRSGSWLPFSIRI